MTADHPTTPVPGETTPCPRCGGAGDTLHDPGGAIGSERRYCHPCGSTYPVPAPPRETTQREEWVVPGVTITEIGGNCPVQAEGTIDGQPFYFRARGETVSIEIGPGNTALVVDAMAEARRDPAAWESESMARDTVGARGCWRYEEHNHDWPAAGWISEEFARAWIALAAVRYRESQPSTSTVIEGPAE